MDLVETVTAVFLGLLGIVQVVILSMWMIGASNRRRLNGRRRRPDTDLRDSTTRG